MDEDTDRLVRVMIMDSLVSQSGKQLTPEVIGLLTSEILGRVMDIVNKKSD